jgi:hypothetical protein
VPGVTSVEAVQDSGAAMKLPNRSAQALAWVAALLGPALLTAMLVRVGGSERRDYIFLYLGLVAVLGVLRGL